MTAALDGHAWPDSFNEFGRWTAGNAIKCTNCGLAVYLIVHSGRLRLAIPINTPCLPITK